MATIQDIIDGLTIIKKYAKNPDVWSGHDIFVAGHKSDEIEKKASPEELAALEKAGWRYHSDYEGWGRWT